MKFKAAAVIAIASGLWAAGAQAASYQNSASGYWGPLDPNEATSVGETFIAPETTLQDFSFYLSDAVSASSGNAKLVIAAWNANDTLGATLYSSTVSFTKAGLGNSAVGVSNIGLSLTVGSEYVAYLDVDGVSSPIKGGIVVGGKDNATVGTGFYADSELGGTYLPRQNLEFTARFTSAVPEPTSYVMLLAGLAMTAGLAVRRRR